MGKIVDSNELLRLAREGRIKSGTKIISNDDCEFLYVFKNETFWDESKEEMSVSELMNHRFEILSEEDEEIDIQSIEEICIRPYKGFVDTCNYIEEKGNELIKAIKQLDKKIKEK